jgi:hypothetical protein
MCANIYKPRAGQVAFERDIDLHRISAFLTRRQYGKTTNASRISLKKMMRTAGHTVVFGSVKLDLGREIVRKESEQMAKAFQMISAAAKQAKMDLQMVNGKDGHQIALEGEKRFLITPDAFAELYEAQRLEFRLYHSRTIYSRTKVVALTPDAVGETGDLILDEVGRVKKFREVWEAVKPIISSNPDFRCLLTTTPPPDDTHYSFELLAPPPGWNPDPAPEGHTYRTEAGVFVRMVTAWDADADGVKLYDDDTGAEISPAESRRRESNKDAWDRNYGVKFVLGGSAACDLLRLQTAQERGIGQCQNFLVETHADYLAALKWIAEHVDPKARIGLGFDVATTTKGTSNPSVLSIVEEHGPEWIVRARMVWKTKDPEIANERLDGVIDLIARRPGGRAVALAQDATNEKYYAEDNRKRLRRQLPVILVVASESVDKPGLDKPVNYKEFTGEALVAKLDDNNLTLPPDTYTRQDYRLVMKDRGRFVCEPDDQGRHGDTFDGDKLGGFALRCGGMGRTIVPATVSVTGVNRDPRDLYKNATPAEFRKTSSL